MITPEQLEQFINRAIRSLKGRKREQTALAIVALCPHAPLRISKVDNELPIERHSWLARVRFTLWRVFDVLMTESLTPLDVAGLS